MVIKPFEIITDDLRTFQYIARVVDQPLILKELHKLRMKYKKRLISRTKLNQLILLLLNDQKLDPLFEGIFRYAVLNGTIRFMGNFSCYPTITKYGDIAIVVKNEATQRDVIELFNKLKSDGVSFIPSSPDIYTRKGLMIIGKSLPFKLKKSKDINTAIMQQRYWYWKNQPRKLGGEGLSQLKIAFDESKNISDIQSRKDKSYQLKDTVRKGIYAYKKLLKSTI